MFFFTIKMMLLVNLNLLLNFQIQKHNQMLFWLCSYAKIMKSHGLKKYIFLAREAQALVVTFFFLLLSGKYAVSPCNLCSFFVTFAHFPLIFKFSYILGCNLCSFSPVTFALFCNLCSFSLIFKFSCISGCNLCSFFLISKHLLQSFY